MDAITGLLEGVRARGAFVLRVVMDPPWSVRIEDEAPVTVVAMVRGGCWLVHDDAEGVRLGPGDVALVRGPDPYVVADDPCTRPTAVIHPGQRCTTSAGEDLSLAMELGVRTWGNDAAGADAFVTGTYEGDSELGRRLVDALPRVALVRAADADTSVIDLLAREVSRQELGQEVMLDRLLDLLFVASVRAWFQEEGREAPAWWRADRDPVVGPALRLVYDDPGGPWTVAELASRVGVSRAGFARRFTDVVGEPPISFLTRWRLALAADRLRDPEATVGAIARDVGYGSAFALSTAFKRTYGVSPTHYRARHPQLSG